MAPIEPCIFNVRAADKVGPAFLNFGLAERAFKMQISMENVQDTQFLPVGQLLHQESRLAMLGTF